MGYWPSNILIAAGLFFPINELLRGYQDVLSLSDFRLLICALAYHHWQAHSAESDGTEMMNDRIRLGVAVVWTVVAGVFLWLR